MTSGCDWQRTISRFKAATIAGGVPAGASMLVETNRPEKPGKPELVEVRHVGHRRRAADAGHGERAHLAALDEAARIADGVEGEMQMSARGREQLLRGRLIGHVHRVDAGALEEQRRDEMAAGADPRRAVVELALVRLGIGDELGEAFHRQHGVHHQEKAVVEQQRHRDEVALHVDGVLLEDERRQHGRAVRADEEGVAVRRRARDRGRADRARAARHVLADEGLAERGLEMIGIEPKIVRRAAGAGRVDHAHRSRRPAVGQRLRAGRCPAQAKPVAAKPAVASSEAVNRRRSNMGALPEKMPSEDAVGRGL